MHPIAFEVQVNWRMLGEGGKRTFSGVEDGSKISTGLDDGSAFVRGEGRIDVDVKVGVSYCPNGCFRVTFGPSH
jgi:hypothetical protein